MAQSNPRLEKFIMSVIGFMLFAPLTLGVLFQFYRKDHHWNTWLNNFSLVGVIVPVVPAPLTWHNVVNAQYQKGLAGRFNADFATREALIRLNDEIYFRLLNVSLIPSINVVVGKGGDLFEQHYLSEYALMRPDVKKLEDFAGDLRRFQDECERRGVGFVLVITPSKASVYPEYIPLPWMRHYDPRPRGYELLLPLLKERGIRYVDGHALIMALKATSPFPVYPLGGTHWTDAGSLTSVNAIIGSLRDQGKSLRPVDEAQLYVTTGRQGISHDIENLMNLAVPLNYTTQMLKPKPLETDPKYNMVIVGGSFMWNLASGLGGSNQFSEIDCYFYYGLSKHCFVYDQKWKLDEPAKPLDFEREIYAADCVVLEINESLIPVFPNHLTKFLSDALANVPPPGGKKPFLVQKYLDYDWGRELSFRSSDPALVRQTSLFGFGPPNAACTWTNSADNGVRLVVPPADSDVMLEAALGARLDKDGTQSAIVAVDGDPVGRWTFSSGSETRRQILIPAKLIGKGGRITVSFHVEHPVGADPGHPEDTSQIGLAFATLRLRLVGAH